MFGVNASPFLAQYASQEHARSHRSDLPSAADVVLQSTYMDDSMTSVATLAEAKSLYHDLAHLWAEANMHARKWLSNSTEVLADIPQEDRVNQLDISSGDNNLPSTKTLGVLWLADSDVFTFQFSQPIINQLTKRQFLKILAAIFDPLGLLAPFIVRAKILFQRMWLEGYDWDLMLPGDLVQEAEKWFSELPSLADVKIPRCLRTVREVPEDAKLHVFVDASEKAFGAAAYFQSEPSSKCLVSSKLKVAPLAAHSIPRLELMAAVFGLQLAQSLLDPLYLAMESVTFWSDSADVLYWIHGQSRKYKPFVAHRVGTIQSESDLEQWNYVPAKLNPADLLTRGLPASQLQSQFWCHGPNMELLENAHQKSVSAAATSEVKAHAVETTQFSNLAIADFPSLNPERYSSVLRLSRVIAWINRFVTNARRLNAHRLSGPLTVQEIRDAEFDLIRQCQRDAFPEEVCALKRGRAIPSSSALISLQPQLDEAGIMRCGGRLRYADHLPPDTRCPVILPKTSRVTSLIIKRSHESLGHASGTNQVLAKLRERFWILSAREAIREFLNRCFTCRRLKAKPSSQIMAPLPSHRTKPSLRAFATTAVDFCGPFMTKQGRGKAQIKRYMAVFTCTATRAVHLEMAIDLSTDAFLNVLSRFVSRRGVPSDIISDNGSNFVGAVSELKRLVGDLDHQKVTNELTALGATWHFNPPAAPHFGGVHESMVKSAKRAVYAVLKKADVTDEELATCFTSVEGMLNARPLTYQSADPTDDVPLTPNHFLFGQTGGTFAPATATTDFNPRKRWRLVQHLLDQTWKRWQREWVPTLNPVRKWRQELPDLKIGDVVIVAASELPRGQWPLARVEDVYPGKDGHVRVVKLCLPNGKNQVRPISKVCPFVPQ